MEKTHPKHEHCGIASYMHCFDSRCRIGSGYSWVVGGNWNVTTCQKGDYGPLNKIGNGEGGPSPQELGEM